MSPQVSVLVRVKNELAALPEFWRRIESQSIAASTEVIFLDNGSTDGTVEFLAGLPCGLFELEGEFNFGRSCNQVASLARSPVLVFLSGHVFLEGTQALEEMAKLVERDPEAAGYARQVPNAFLGFSSYEAAYLLKRFPAGEGPVKLSSPGAFSNAASVISRKTWQQQPFEEMHGSEDFEWAKRHLARGGSVFYLPHVLTLHSHNEDPEKVHKRIRMNARAKGETGSYAKSAYMLAGVYVSMRRVGATHSEAWAYARAHAQAYL